jgi:hypothetical protein
MNQYAKDPLFVISLLLAVSGAIQTSTGLLSKLADQYPISFGIVMTAISATTAVLTAVKTHMINNPPSNGQNSGV